MREVDYTGESAGLRRFRVPLRKQEQRQRQGISNDDGLDSHPIPYSDIDAESGGLSWGSKKADRVYLYSRQVSSWGGKDDCRVQVTVPSRY
jgi:hypothetical protein